MSKKNDAQLDLFAPARSASPLAAVPPPDPKIVALAERLPKHLHLGASSWNFRGWTGVVYRAPYKSDKQFVRDSLYEYARWPLFRTVGIDRSFYAPLTAEELTHYAALLPSGFRCIEKVWQEISTFMFPKHPRYGERSGKVNGAFLDLDLFTREVLAPHARAFSDHVAAFVFEVSPLPSAPNVAFLEDKLERFLTQAPRSFHYAFELRDERLMTPRYFALLREHGASHCFNQWSHVPPIREQLRLHGRSLRAPVVVRLLLPHGADYEDLVESYAPFDRLHAVSLPMREDVREIVEIAGAEALPTYIIINNKAEGSAPLTAIGLADLISTSAASAR